MSSIPGYSLEAWLEEEFFLHITSITQDHRSRLKYVTRQQFKQLVVLFEEHREYVEERLSDFDEENQSWRAYNSAVFGAYFEDKVAIMRQAEALIASGFNDNASTTNRTETMTYSKDMAMGLVVHEHLKLMGVETPATMGALYNKDKIQDLFALIMKEIGLDLSDDSLAETPRRLAKLYTSEYCNGLDYANFPTATVVENKMGFDEMVLERNVQVRSLCEHHFLPIVGGAFVAYIPEKKVLGLSKINRVVDFFCRRPQIQERLTMQIYYALECLLETENIAVIIQAEHLCVKTRGVEDPCSDTVTSKLGGKFKEGSMRAEFIALAKGLV